MVKSKNVQKGERGRIKNDNGTHWLIHAKYCNHHDDTEELNFMVEHKILYNETVTSASAVC